MYRGAYRKEKKMILERMDVLDIKGENESPKCGRKRTTCGYA
jgi:hypothetical protein